MNFYENEETKLMRKVTLLQDENVRLSNKLDELDFHHFVETEVPKLLQPKKKEPSLEQSLKSFMKAVRRDLKKLF